MKQNILLISYNFKPEPTGIGKYNGEMIEWLAKNGFNCSVITTYPYYPYWKVQQPYYNNRFNFKKEKIEIENSEITIYRCPQYVPQEPSGLKRILQEISFFFSASIKLAPLLFKKKIRFSYNCCAFISDWAFRSSFQKKYGRPNFYITYKTYRLKPPGI